MWSAVYSVFEFSVSLEQQLHYSHYSQNYDSEYDKKIHKTECQMVKCTYQAKESIQQEKAARIITITRMISLTFNAMHLQVTVS